MKRGIEIFLDSNGGSRHSQWKSSFNQVLVVMKAAIIIAVGGWPSGPSIEGLFCRAVHHCRALGERKIEKKSKKKKENEEKRRKNGKKERKK